ncbi:Ff.00g112470.m01.CDS01 [Fusarium sp. VM40]|nr:Ff.00g112470.m01.CDS01 [Fusarium sp. VM40]
MSSALTTSVFILPFAIYKSSVPTVSVIDANPTATTLQFLCPAGPYQEVCDKGGFNNTIVVGPWASKTVPEGAPSTGTFHWMLTRSGMGSSSIECPVSSGTPLACTFQAVAEADESFPAESITQIATGAKDISESLELSFSTLPVVITAGQDRLKSAAQATATRDSTSSEATKEATGTSSDETSATATSTEASPTETNGVGSSASRVFGAMFMAGMASLIVQF